MRQRPRTDNSPERPYEARRVVVGVVREVQRVVGVDSDDSPVRFLQFEEEPGDEDGGDATVRSPVSCGILQEMAKVRTER